MHAQNWPYEIIFIDDGSDDGTFERLQELQRQDPKVRIFHWGRNLGKSAALAKGFQEAHGDYVVTLDGDLQDNPSEILRLWEVLHAEQADLVCGWKKNRKDPWSKILSSRLFNFAVQSVTGLPLHDFNCGLKLYRRAATKTIPMYGELHRFIPAIAFWKGFRVREQAVEHRPRKFGRSKYGFSRIVPGMIDLLNIAFLTRYERKPSHLFSALGALLFLTGVLINFHLLAIKLAGGSIAPHYPYMILGAITLVVGAQLVFFGLLSEMILYLFLTQKEARSS